MFEFFIAKKYLIPRKKQLSASLIALLSILVISLVVWLLLLFLSITQGMEKTWLSKLTSLHAPVQITPTAYYRNSYFHQIDNFCLESGYKTKTIREKLEAQKSDPYDQETDQELPDFFPKKDLTKEQKLKDPVKIAFAAIEQLKKKDPSMTAEPFTKTGVLLKLKLIRNDPQTNLEHHSFLTQMCFASSFSETSSFAHDLLMPLSEQDFKHLLYLSSLDYSYAALDTSYLSHPVEGKKLKERLHRLFKFARPTLGKISSSTPFYFDEFPEKAVLDVLVYNPDEISHFVLPERNLGFFKPTKPYTAAKLYKVGHQLICKFSNKEKGCSLSVPLYLQKDLSSNIELPESALENTRTLSDLFVLAPLEIQGHLIKKKVPLTDIFLEIIETNSSNSSAEELYPPWVYYRNNRAHLPHYEGKDQAILLPKQFKDSGVLVGDRGYLSYGALSPNAVQEQRLAIYVSGFYDPGVLSVGARALMISHQTLEMIAQANAQISGDDGDSEGIQIWFSNLNRAQMYAKELKNILDKEDVGSYFKVQTFYDYDFARDLLMQFQSDRHLFTLIGIIILIVACSNIISFLILMINDKKKEIGILLSMGASQRSIMTIFAFCGACLGLIGSFLGTSAAYFTLKHIDFFVNLLSQLQGHNLFHESFYGAHLPNTLSPDSFLFIAISTPLLSLFAALIPALKASRLQPTAALRSE